MLMGQDEGIESRGNLSVRTILHADYIALLPSDSNRLDEEFHHPHAEETNTLVTKSDRKELFEPCATGQGG